MNADELQGEYADSDFGDPRRTRRLLRMVERLGAAPDLSLPDGMRNDAELEGAYRFLNNDAIAVQKLLASHFSRTRERAGKVNDVWVAHDTTCFRFSDDREGLGPVTHKKGAQGFYAHVSLAIGSNRMPLGVTGLHTYVRAPQRKARRRAAGEAGEQDRFKELIEASEERLGLSVRPIHVIDREADSYALLAHLVTKSRRFVIRVGRDRRTSTPRETKGSFRMVSEMKDCLEGVAQREVALTRRVKKGFGTTPLQRKIHPAREGRMAQLQFRATSVKLRRPQRVSSSLPVSLSVHVVYVDELNPPEGQPAVQWTLWTTEPIQTAEQVLSLVDAYRARWTIEEFFKALKTGCSFEKRQLRSYTALCRLLAILLPIAWQLLQMRHVARSEPEQPATLFLRPSLLAVLHATSERVPLPPNPTIREAFCAIAGVGGHLKRNGPPGWLTLGRGFEKLLILEEGYLAARCDQS